MKLTIEQADFTTALKKLTGVAPAKSTIPILQNVLIKAQGEKVTFTATNHDIEVTVTSAATIETEGATTVPFKMLSDVVVKTKKGALVTVDFDGRSVAVRSGRTRANLATLDAQDFPHMASNEYEVTLDIAAHELQDLFDKTAFAASTDESRYYLKGVYLTQDDGRMTGVATDGHRLALWRSSVADDFPSVIVPSGTIAALHLPESGDVAVSISETKIRFAMDDWVMVSKVIDGMYPDYKRIIPQCGGSVAKFSGQDLKAAVDRVGVVLDKVSNAVVFDVTQEGIALSGHSGSNSVEDFVDAALEGDDVRIGFSGKYVTTAMQKLEGAAVMEFSGSMDPAAIRDDAAPDWMLVVMPMRV